MIKLMASAGRALFFGFTVATAADNSIRSGEVWPDDRGKHVQAHGGAISKYGDTFYWFGEDYSPGNDKEKRYVACYASEDLVHWTFRNQVIKLSDPEGFGSNWIIERPKVYYNATTKKFVMYMHLDASALPNGPGGPYALARMAVATCDTVDGDYVYQRSFRPLGRVSRDIGQFVDDDGSAYIIFESRPTKGFFIDKLSADYLNVEKEVAFIKEPLEGGALVHYKGLYYVVGSRMTGWNANPNEYASAEHLEGPWSDFKSIAPGSQNTYGAQSTFLLKLTGTKVTTVVFMGDKWKGDALADSRYLWMPLEIDAGVMTLPEPKEWTIDTVTGEAAVKPR